MTAAHELDNLVEEMLPAATELAVCVRDRDIAGVHAVLGPLLDVGDRTRIGALVVALAALVPDDIPFGQLLAWTHNQDQLPLGELVLDGAEKYCRGCDQVRPRRAFYVDRSRHDGFTSRCKFCVTERNEQRRARLDTASRGEGAA